MPVDSTAACAVRRRRRGYLSSSTTGPTRPTRSSSRPARSRSRGCPRSPSGSTPASSSSTAASTGAGRRPRRPGPRGRRREHRLPDRGGALTLARRPPLHRLAADAAAAALARPRPVPLPRTTGLMRETVEVAVRSANAGPRHAHRLEPTRRAADTASAPRARHSIFRPRGPFADGADSPPSAVIWATGFMLDHSWIASPVFDDRGRLVHQRGVTAAPGLSFLGMPWQYTAGRRCSAGSRTTPTTSPPRSPPAPARAGIPPPDVRVRPQKLARLMTSRGAPYGRGSAAWVVPGSNRGPLACVRTARRDRELRISVDWVCNARRAGHGSSLMSRGRRTSGMRQALPYGAKV